MLVGIFIKGCGRERMHTCEGASSQCDEDGKNREVHFV